MSIVQDEYQSKVIDDINDFKSFNHSVKASFLERAIIKRVSKSRLHPNPADEFSVPEVGSNYGIVSDYEERFRQAIGRSMDPFQNDLTVDRFMVTKMSLL